MPRRSVLILAAIALVVAIGGGQTWAAYNATTASNANSFASGTVALTDNDSGAALLTLATAVPGDTDTGCITVTYTGSLASAVHLYGTTSTAGTGLDAYLDLKITRGTFTGAAPAFDACTNFTPDATSYGSGNGVVYDGTLLAYPDDDYLSGIVDPPAGGAESWTSGESHVYKLQVTLRDDIAAKGKNATQTFTWEARNT